MATSSVALISADPDLRERLAEAFGPRATVTRLPDREELLRELAVLKPSLVLVDVGGQQPTEAIRKAADAAQAADAGLEVVALGDASNANLVITALRAGAVDFVDRSGEPAQLREQVLQRVATVPLPERGAPGDFTVVLGAGASATAGLFATNLAVLRAKAAGEGLLIDCAMPQPEADAALDLSPAYGLADAVRDLDRLDRTLLGSALAVHEASGLRLMPLAGRPDDETSLSPEHVLDALRTVRPLFRETVLYLGGVRHPQILAAVAAAATRLCLVAPQTYTAVRDAKALLDAIPTDLGARARTVLVVEEYSDDIALTDVQMRQTLGLASSVRLPAARAELLNSLNVGRPLVLDAPACAYARALQSLADVQPPSERRPFWARLKEGLLSRKEARA